MSWCQKISRARQEALARLAIVFAPKIGAVALCIRRKRCLLSLFRLKFQHGIGKALADGGHDLA